MRSVNRGAGIVQESDMRLGCRRAGSLPGGVPSLAVGLLVSGGCIVPLPTPQGRAGRLTEIDGRPVANATVVVETLDVATPPSGDWPGTPIHRFETRTDGEGRWRVPGGLALRFGIPVPDAMPLQDDQYTFTAPDGRTLRVRPDLHGQRPRGEVAPTLHSDWDGPLPTSATLLPAFGVMGGAAQTVSGHLGVLLLVFRGELGVGVRAAAEAGATGAGASLAIVTPYRASAPWFGLEVGARYLRPWSDGASRAWIAPELGLDLLANVRLTLTLLALGNHAASAAGRSPALGIGWGFF
jgi:hypothetical protein